jgi:hypothetical protein
VYDDVFDLTYFSNGALSYDDVLDMPAVDREEYKRRLTKVLREKAKVEASIMKLSGTKV